MGPTTPEAQTSGERGTSIVQLIYPFFCCSLAFINRVYYAATKEGKLPILGTSCHS